MLARPLQIVYVPISELKLDPKNPRKHSKQQTAQLATSIGIFGFNVPALIDDENNVLVGNGRIGGALLRGINVVPVIRLSHLSKAQARAFALADNKLTDNSSWDDQLLGEVLRDLTLMDLDFSIESTGFSMAEIDFCIESLSSAPDNVDPADQALPLTGGKPTSQVGDLWQLRKHYLLCADALDSASYVRLMGTKKAALAFTDPPYNVPVEGHVSGKGRNRHREFPMATGEMSGAEFSDFLKGTCSQLAEHSVRGSILYLCIDWRHAETLLAAGRETGFQLINICVWTKHNAGMGSLYRSQHEFVAVFKNGQVRHRNNVQLGKFGRNRTNVWDYPGANNFGRTGEEGNLSALHPTVKPVQLVADAILDCSARGDLVLDPFLGSGTTLIAAERTGRVCHGMELDPLYIDVAIRRWQKHTGDDAIHVASGKRFNDIEAEALHG